MRIRQKNKSNWNLIKKFRMKFGQKRNNFSTYIISIRNKNSLRIRKNKIRQDFYPILMKTRRKDRIFGINSYKLWMEIFLSDLWKINWTITKIMRLNFKMICWKRNCSVLNPTFKGSHSHSSCLKSIMNKCMISNKFLN